MWKNRTLSAKVGHADWFVRVCDVYMQVCVCVCVCVCVQVAAPSVDPLYKQRNKKRG